MQNIKNNYVVIGAGSNLTHPKCQILRAEQAIRKLPKTILLKRASLYQNQALGNYKQPQFINTVFLLKTSLSANNLWRHLTNIEKQQGRKRRKHWGPRTIDLDIILYKNQNIKNKELSIPHKQMYHRDFVIVPLCEIAPNITLPRQQVVLDLTSSLASASKPNLTVTMLLKLLPFRMLTRLDGNKSCMLKF